MAELINQRWYLLYNSYGTPVGRTTVFEEALRHLEERPRFHYVVIFTDKGSSTVYDAEMLRAVKL